MEKIQVTDNNFKTEVLDETGVVLVDFWASWCGPCQAFAPTIEKMAKDLEGKVKVRKLEVDENPETARTFHVMSIPTTMIFKNGEVVEQFIGVQTEKNLLEVLSKYTKI